MRIQGQTAYRVSWSLPLLGYAGVWLHDASNRARLMFFGGVLLLLTLVYVALPSRFRHRLRVRRPMAQAAATAKESAPAH